MSGRGRDDGPVDWGTSAPWHWSKGSVQWSELVRRRIGERTAGANHSLGSVEAGTKGLCGSPDVWPFQKTGESLRKPNEYPNSNRFPPAHVQRLNF